MSDVPIYRENCWMSLLLFRTALISILLWVRNCTILSFFLNFCIESDIITYNAIGVGYMPWQTDVDKCALPVGRAFYFGLANQIPYVLSVRKTKNADWQNKAKKELRFNAGIDYASAIKMRKNGHMTTVELLKVCSTLSHRIDYILRFILVSSQFAVFNKWGDYHS